VGEMALIISSQEVRTVVVAHLDELSMSRLQLPDLRFAELQFQRMLCTNRKSTDRSSVGCL